MVIKIFGCLMILISGYFVSRKILSYEVESLARIEAAEELICAVKSRIENYCMPVNNILKDIPKDILIRCGYDPLQLPDSIDRIINECPFSDDTEVYFLFERFFSTLGTAYKAEELSRCSIARDELSAVIERRASEGGKREKTVPALCICISLAIAVVVI